MGDRRRAREFALQILFQIEINDTGIRESLEGFWESRPTSQTTRGFTERLVRGTLQHRKKIDILLAETSENWRLERMPAVDRNILRLAVYEFLSETDIPHVVAIDEAIEMAKRFGGNDSGQFINGVLDSVRKKLESAGGAETGSVDPPPEPA